MISVSREGRQNVLGKVQNHDKKRGQLKKNNNLRTHSTLGATSATSEDICIAVIIIDNYGKPSPQITWGVGWGVRYKQSCISTGRRQNRGGKILHAGTSFVVLHTVNALWGNIQQYLQRHAAVE